MTNPDRFNWTVEQMHEEPGGAVAELLRQRDALKRRKMSITYVEDSQGWQAVYLDDRLVMQSDILDWLDLLAALEKHPSVQMARLAFKDRDIEDYPEHLDDVLMWQLEEA